jgi:hypothetical protein
VATLHTGHVDATALDAGKLVVLHPTQLAVYNPASASRERTIPVPRATANRLDVQYGIAVLAAGHQALAVDLTTGREAVVGRAASRLLGVALERPGVAFASTGPRGGLAGFVPLARVQSLLGRR